MTHTTSPKILDEQTAAALFKVMQRHTDDPSTGKCARCHVHHCNDYRFARTQLQEAGQIMPDAPPGATYIIATDQATELDELVHRAMRES